MNKLTEYRKRAGLTQKELGQKVGVIPTSITQYESGKRKPSIITLKKLAAVLNCTTDELLEDMEIKED